MKHPAFEDVTHRPWPLTERPWILEQDWLDLLFLHWEISPSALQLKLPEGLELDTYDGVAWLGLVPFSMKGVGPRGFPKPKFISDFPEINVRTYVVSDGKPGVFFFSLDIPNALPVWLARTFFHLPYFKADMDVRKANDGNIHYKSEVEGRTFDALFHGLSPVTLKNGSFEDWATERYCLYSHNEKNGKLYRGEIQHQRWPLKQARYEIRSNTMLKEFDVGRQHPSALFCPKISVAAWAIQEV